MSDLNQKKIVFSKQIAVETREGKNGSSDESKDRLLFDGSRPGRESLSRSRSMRSDFFGDKALIRGV